MNRRRGRIWAAGATAAAFIVAGGKGGFAAPAARENAPPVPPPPAVPSAVTLNIRDFGAKGDGKTKDTLALQKALDACAATVVPGTVRVPAGVYRIGSIVIGPHTTLHLDRGASLVGSGDIDDHPLAQVRWEGEFASGHRALISAEKADDIAITGPGAIFGPPIDLSHLRNPRGPCLIELTECRHVLLDGFSTSYQQLWSIHPLFCEDVTARNLTIRSINFNGDGIDVDSCRNVVIEHCDINTGDDAIALKSGRGRMAAALSRPTEDVRIENCTLASSIFAGLAIGTEMSGGIRDVRVENCTLSGRQNAIYIKSRDGRGGFIENIAAKNLLIFDSPRFLSINLVTPGIQASDPFTDPAEKWARVQNLSFRNVTVRGVGQLVAADRIPAERPVDGLVLADISGDSRSGIALAHMKNVQVSGIGVKGVGGQLVTSDDVTGTGLDAPTAAAATGAAAFIAPKPKPEPASPTRPLASLTDETQLAPSSAQVTVRRQTSSERPALEVSIAPGADGYPGVRVTPPTPGGKPWDLSAYGHVEATVTNTGDRPLNLGLRVDNNGDWRDNPWDTEQATLQPGETQTLKTIFGYSYGFKPGYKLKPNAVVGVLLFTTKTDHPESFRLQSLVAGGPSGETPPVAPESVRIVPKDGLILGGDTAPELTLREDLRATPEGKGLRLTFPSSANGGGEVSLKPPAGRWDLRHDLLVRVRVRNTGTVPVRPRVRLETNGGWSDWATTDAPLAPGAEGQVVASFLPKTTPDVGKPDTLPKITSDAVAAVTLGLEPGGSSANGGERSLLVTEVRAEMPPPPRLPEWLGKRPPVPGDWVPTLREEFSGTTLDTSLWDPYGENWYDKVSHWSKDDVIVVGGVARLRYEKKTGPQNDDPKRASSPYAAGYLNAVGKWAQRYGYFEARMRLPRAPGLWPAFWMMPDRGASAGEARQDTASGGMEFDIMEHLTRWGPTRYNIAMHWDGYGKDHKSNGSDHIYVAPDKDGYITCGLLWLPGSATYYCNGREVLHWENPRITSVPETLLFTLPSGGWDNDALDDARLPDDFVIDYVRVWQRKDLASAVDSPPHLRK